MRIANEALWTRAVDFHGHACPGLAIGFRMVLEAASFLGIDRAAEDEEIVCITENDACCVDAAQALLGCTLGKGNLLLKPRGKAAMTFYLRSSGKGCRAVWLGLGERVFTREEKIAFLLSSGSAACFSVREVEGPVPEKAQLCRSVPCVACGERVSETMLRPYEGGLYCLDCWPNVSRILP